MFPSFQDINWTILSKSAGQDAESVRAAASRGAVCAAAATGTAAIAKDGELFAWGFGQAPDGWDHGSCGISSLDCLKKTEWDPWESYDQGLLTIGFP